MIDAFCVMAYWLSHILIGFAVLLFVKNSKGSLRIIRSARSITERLLRLGIATTIVSAFVVYNLIVALQSIFYYTFNVRAGVAVAAYLLLLGLSGIYLLFSLIRSLHMPIKLTQAFSRLNVLTVIVWILLLSVVVADVFASYWTNSFSGGDAIYHMSRVKSIVDDGFNTRSSFFSTVPENGYHVNMIYQHYVVGAKMMKYEPMHIWSLSLPFFRLMMWAMIYVFLKYISHHLLKIKGLVGDVFAPAATIASISLYSGVFFVANYPSQVRTLWLIVLFMSLIEFMKRTRGALLGVLTASLLIALTHPVFSLFTGLIVLAVLLFDLLIVASRKKDTKSISIIRSGSLLLSAMILFSTPLVTFLMPKYATEQHTNLALGSEINIWGGMIMRSPEVNLYATGSHYLGVFIAIITFVSFVFFVLKFYRDKSIILPFTVFYLVPLSILYFPPFYTIFRQYLPIWVLDRALGIDVLYLIAPSIMGIVGLYIVRRIKLLSAFAEQLLFVGVMVAISFATAIPSYEFFTRYSPIHQNNYERYRIVTNDFKHLLRDNAVVIAADADAYDLSSTFNIDIVSMEYAHMPLTADGSNRSACLAKILSDFSIENLKETRAKYIVLSQTDPRNQQLQSGKYPYIQSIADDKYYKVYSINLDDRELSVTPPIDSCTQYKKTESRQKGTRN